MFLDTPEIFSLEAFYYVQNCALKKYRFGAWTSFISLQIVHVLLSGITSGFKLTYLQMTYPSLWNLVI